MEIPTQPTIKFLSPTVNNIMPINGKVSEHPDLDSPTSSQSQDFVPSPKPSIRTHMDHSQELLKPRIEEVDSHDKVLSSEHAVSSIPSVPVTVLRKPYINTDTSPYSLHNAGTARANIAPSHECPHGTTHNSWACNHSHETVLQQHCFFFDRDHDGVIWPYDTFIGFHALGFGIILSLVAVVIIHANFSYPSLDSWIPDPFFRLYIKNIHMCKHGSDSGTYDREGRYVPQHFEDIFSKYADGRDYVTLWDVAKMLRGQRCVSDPIGWGGAFFEWLATYLMLWPADGRMMKADIRGIYDGSIFYTIAARRSNKKTR